jgi:hypothetical protein
MNHWVVAFPCLLYPASFGACSSPRKSKATPCADVTDAAMGLMFIYQTSRPDGVWYSMQSNVGLPYFSISVSLNVILTVLIAARLILHKKNIRSAMGSPTGIRGMSKVAVTILVESCALYALNSLLYIGSRGARSYVASIFLPILAQTQVRTVFNT